MVEGGRFPPQDIEAEEAVLGSLLIDSQAIFKVAPILKPDDFSGERNRLAYGATLSIYNRNEPINQVSLSHELARENRLEPMGGMGFINHLVAIVPTSVHVEHYARIVQRTATLRRLIDAANTIARMGYEGGPDVDSVLSRAEEVLLSLRAGYVSRDFATLQEVLNTYLAQSMDTQDTPTTGQGPVSIPTGFIDLDNLLGGLRRSNLVILAALTSLGKTSLAINIARNAALSKEHPATVAIFSLEMSQEEVALRLLSNESGIDTQQLQKGHFNERTERRVMDAIGVLSDARIYIDDTPALSVAEMRSKARRLARERSLDLVIVDYLQLARGSLRTENRVQEVSEISRSLKGLARDVNVPVLALSQLSRAPMQRREDRHRPQLSDLRESGSIEQDADVVLFIHREDKVITPDRWARDYPDKPFPRGIAEVIVAKHRNGPTDSINLLFLEKTAQFRNLEKRAA